MRKVVGGFDPSPEPLRPMGQAHRGVPKAVRPPRPMGPMEFKQFELV